MLAHSHQQQQLHIGSLPKLGDRKTFPPMPLLSNLIVPTLGTHKPNNRLDDTNNPHQSPKQQHRIFGNTSGDNKKRVYW